MSVADQRTGHEDDGDNKRELFHNGFSCSDILLFLYDLKSCVKSAFDRITAALLSGGRDGAGPALHGTEQ